MAEGDRIRELEAALDPGGDRVGAGEVIRTGGWIQVTTPDARTHHRNGVIRSVLEPDALDARIHETIEHYRLLGVPFRWVVTPSTRPSDTAEALLRKGFTHLETLHAMVADPADFPPHRDGGVAVERIGPDGIEAWVECSGRGWGMPPAGAVRFRAELRRALARRDPTTSYFLARCGGETAGASSLELRQGYAHFNGAVVPEEFRGRGVYRAMVLERMEFLRQRGVRLVTNHCVSTTSAPICARLGFRRVCDFEVYVFGGGS